MYLLQSLLVDTDPTEEQPSSSTDDKTPPPSGHG